MEVPKDAVTVHLALLNTFSNILSNLEALRGSSVDPIGGMVGMSQYNNNINSLKTALSNMNVYFSQKLGTQ